MNWSNFFSTLGVALLFAVVIAVAFGLGELAYRLSGRRDWLAITVFVLVLVVALAAAIGALTA